jgi:hypothetical protein
LFGATVGKDTVSRRWRKVKSDWDAWNILSLAEEPIVQLIINGTIVRGRLDRKATWISLLVLFGVRADGKKVPLRSRALAAKEPRSGARCSADLIKRGLRRPSLSSCRVSGRINT